MVKNGISISFSPSIQYPSIIHPSSTHPVAWRVDPWSKLVRSLPRCDARPCAMLGSMPSSVPSSACSSVHARSKLEYSSSRYMALDINSMATWLPTHDPVRWDGSAQASTTPTQTLNGPAVAGGAEVCVRGSSRRGRFYCSRAAPNGMLSVPAIFIWCQS